MLALKVINEFILFKTVSMYIVQMKMLQQFKNAKKCI